MTLDLVLVNPADQQQAYQGLASDLTAIEPPIWTGLLATHARRQGFSVAIVDAAAEGLDAEKTARQVLKLNPLLAAVVVYGHHPSASTQYMTAAGAVCAAMKRLDPDQRVLLVGGHVAALPERTLQEEKADFVCGGEGPVTLMELLQALRGGRQDLTRVRGLWYREGDRLRANEPAPLVQDLDGDMPEVAWDLLPMSRYRAHNWHCFGGLRRQPYAALYTTLGCPFHCTFCCIQAPFRTGEQALKFKPGVNSYRRWSPEVVVAQIDKLVQQYGVRNLKIADELFVLNPSHVHGICDLLIQRDYGLNIWAYARVDTIKEDMIEKLKGAGVNWLALGIEAASERVREQVEKGFSHEQLSRTIEAVRAAGINIIGNYIFGLPEDDLETMQATLDLAQGLNCEFANFYCAMAYPGSRLYEQAVRENWPLPESWSGYAQHARDTLPLPTKYVSGPQVLRFRDEAFQQYFTGGRYKEMIMRRFGPETAQQVREMATRTLQRDQVGQAPTLNLVTPQMPEADRHVLDRLAGQYAKPGMVAFELGTYTGRSSLVILRHVREMNGRLYCVDWFRGNPGVETGEFGESFTKYNVLDIFLSNVKAAGYEDHVNVLVGTTDGAAKVITDETADFIFIDADHRYSRIRSDIINWYPKLKKGGLLCGHDFERHLHECDYERVLAFCEQDYADGCHYGVIRAVSEFFPDVRREGTIWYVEKGR